MLGADRDSEVVAEIFDEREPAVTEYIELLIARARELGLQTSICGQAPSVYPEYAELLVRAGSTRSRSTWTRSTGPPPDRRGRAARDARQRPLSHRPMGSTVWPQPAGSLQTTSPPRIVAATSGTPGR